MLVQTDVNTNKETVLLYKKVYFEDGIEKPLDVRKNNDSLGCDPVLTEFEWEGVLTDVTVGLHAGLVSS